MYRRETDSCLGRVESTGRVFLFFPFLVPSFFPVIACRISSPGVGTTRCTGCHITLAIPPCVKIGSPIGVMLHIILKVSSILIFEKNNIQKIPNKQVFTAILRKKRRETWFYFINNPCEDHESVNYGINSG